MNTSDSKPPRMEPARTVVLTALLSIAALGTAVVPFPLDAFPIPPSATVEKSAVLFRGDNNQHVEVSRPADFNLTANFTIEAWVNVTVWDTGTRYAAIVAKGDAWGIVREDRNQRVVFRTLSGNTFHDLPITNLLTPGRWYHIAAVYDGAVGMKQIYVDGRLNNSASYALPVNVNALPVAFASNLQFPSQRNFKGTFDTIRIWSVARTGTEIVADLGRDLRGDEPGLLGEWRFNEPSGTAALDSSVAGRHGTLRNTVETDRVMGIQFRFSAPVAGVPKNAIRFEGDTRQRILLDEFHRADFNPVPGNALTLEAWVNVAAFTRPGQAIVTKGSAWGLARHGSTRKLTFRTHNGTAIHDLVSQADILSNRWYHVAAVYDGTNKWLYLDGELDNSTSYGATLLSNAAPVVIGNNAADVNEAFQGDIDLVRVWSSSRTAAELNASLMRELNGGESGLLAEWRFNEPAGFQALDNSFGERHAQLIHLYDGNRVNGLSLAPAPPPEANVAKGALQFRGTLDSPHVEIGNEPAFDLVQAVTVEAWVNISEWTQPWQPIVTKGEAWGITRFDATPRIAFRTHLGHAASDLGSTAELQSNRWYHVAAVYDGARKYLYIDGKLDSSTPFTRSLLNNAFPVAIGGNAERPERGFKGRIDNVRAWSEPRTATEIAGHYDRVVRGSENGLLGEWRFDEASGAVALDSSPRGNHGTLGAMHPDDDRVNGLHLRDPAPGHLAISFNSDGATGHHAEVPSSGGFNFPLQMTVECWVWFADYPGTTAALVSKGSTAWELKLRPSGKVQFSTEGVVDADGKSRKDMLSAGTLSRQEWHHVAVTWDPLKGEKRIFIDGRLDEVESGLQGSLGVNSWPVLFAAEPQAAGQQSFFRGILDEIRLWESARSGDQVLQSCNRYVNGTEPRLAGVWSLDEGSGMLLRNARAGSGVHGLLQGGMTSWNRVDGVALSIPIPSQYALVFDGVDDFIEIPHHPDYNLAGAATFEAWIKPEGQGVRPVLFKGETGYGVALDANNFVRFYIDAFHAAALSSSRPVQDGAWSHIAVVVDGARATTAFYINGKPAGTHAVAVLNNNTEPLYIGRRGGPSGLFFQGQIDEVRIWNVARSSLEIEFLAFGSLPLESPGLAGYWAFNAGSGMALEDGSRVHNDGVLVNMTAGNWVEGQLWGVPVLDADLNLAADPNTGGLWIGQVQLNKVNEAQRAINSVAEELTPTADAASLRILLHVNAAGQVQMLKDVIVMRTRLDPQSPDSPEKIVLVTDPIRIPEYEGVVRRGGKLAALRYGTATFDFEGNELPLLGGVGPGVACAGVIELPEAFPTNPFRHKFHPEHRVGYDIRRQFSIQFDGAPGQPLAEAPGYGVQRLTGTYRETILGLHKIPLKVEGTLTLNRISTTTVLNDRP